MTSSAIPATRTPLRALVGPTIMTAIMLAILVALGTWQVHRLHWKRAILADIDRAEASPPVPLPDHPLPFTKVTITGVLRGDLSARYGVEVRDLPEGSAMGEQLIQPLERPGQPPVLVDRGWVPDGYKDTGGGPMTVVGYIRNPDTPGLFSPSDDPAGRLFYTLDPAAIGAALGLQRVAPFTVVAMGEGGIPAPASALPRPPNDHLNYALTWYGLALTLLAVFAAYARKVLRP